MKVKKKKCQQHSQCLPKYVTPGHFWKLPVDCVINELLVVNCKHIHASKSHYLTLNLLTGENLENGKCDSMCQIDIPNLGMLNLREPQISTCQTFTLR